MKRKTILQKKNHWYYVSVTLHYILHSLLQRMTVISDLISGDPRRQDGRKRDHDK